MSLVLTEPAWRVSVPESHAYDYLDMTDPTAIGTLHELTLLHCCGSDAQKFLQGQLSNDCAALTADRFTLAGLHSPQGRVLAVLRLAAPAPDHIVALLPTDLAELALSTLRRYVLRAKVTMTATAAAHQDPAAPLSIHLPPLQSHALDIAAGIPQVYAATSGEFVAQMLNLDCIDAISFSKGCYTGQEIIARAHYRGRMKRRMQRFLTDAPTTLMPGQSVTLSDGRNAVIVDAVVRTDGRMEFLAVTQLSVHAAGDAATDGAADTAPRPPPLDCKPLPLPYLLPQ